MQRFEQLREVEGTDVLSAVELARMAQGQRFAKLQAPPPVIGAPAGECHVVEALPEPEPEPELEPELGSLSAMIAVPVGPAIGFVSPGVNCRDEVCSYVGMSSGGPACKSDHHVAHTREESGAFPSLTCWVGAGCADMQTLETGELGASQLEQFRLQFGASVLKGNTAAANVDVPVCTPPTHCNEDSSDAGSTRSSPGDAPDFPQQLQLGDESDEYGSKDDKRSRAVDSGELVWRRAW
eukprot:COSAG02_NODE_8655_length_2489_cov_1.815063_1_plen_238_part_00